MTDDAQLIDITTIRVLEQLPRPDDASRQLIRSVLKLALPELRQQLYLEAAQLLNERQAANIGEESGLAYGALFLLGERDRMRESADGGSAEVGDAEDSVEADPEVPADGLPDARDGEEEPEPAADTDDPDA